MHLHSTSNIMHSVLCLFYVGQSITEGSVCSVLHKAGIESPDWVSLTRSLGLDSIILPAAFFNQWTVVADDRRPSWKTLAKALGNIQNYNYKQAAIEALQMEGMYSQ